MGLSRRTLIIHPTRQSRPGSMNKRHKRRPASGHSLVRVRVRVHVRVRVRVRDFKLNENTSNMLISIVATRSSETFNAHISGHRDVGLGM